DHGRRVRRQRARPVPARCAAAGRRRRGDARSGRRGAIPMSGAVELTPLGLSPAEVLAVARADTEVVIGADAHAAMQESADVVTRLADSDAPPAYGISTGFGSLALVR